MASIVPMPRPFSDRILPAPKTPAFQMDGYWVWCGSAIKGEDGRYHLFASRWPKTVSFFHWADQFRSGPRFLR